MPPTFDYNRQVAQAANEAGFLTIDPAAEGYDSYEALINTSELDSEIDLRTTPSPTTACAPTSWVRRLQAYADVGLGLVLVQCSPMLEEVQRIGRDVIPRLHATTAV